jgi:type IV pilus assembly protein PilW
MNIVSQRLPASRQAGFGLVEAMIGMIIALLTSLAIFQTFAVNEAQRRTTGSGSEALQAGTLAMSQIQKIVRNAGYNMTTPTDPLLTPPARSVVEGAGAVIINPTTAASEFLIGCVAPALASGIRRITPALATAGAGPLISDTIVVMQGNSAASPIPSLLVTPVPAGTTTLQISTTYGYALNDWVIIYEQSPTINTGNLRPVPCTLARVTALPPGPPPPASPISPAAITLNTGTLAPYSNFARVVNLGRTPLFESLTVNAGTSQLMLNNLINNTSRVLADNVVAMKVQTGIDVSNDDVVDEWINPPLAEAGWLNPNAVPTAPSIAALPVAAAPNRALNELKALRVGVLIRSSNFERPNAATGQCDVTGAGPFTVLPADPGNAAQRVPAMPSSGNYNLAGNQRCYRYNTLTSVIPLRNIIMGDI